MADPLRIAPSILSADHARLGEEIADVEAGGADWLHVDVMDGHFVPNLTIGPPILRSLRAVTRLPLDVHLMIEDPDASLDAYAAAGADGLTVHAEACVHLHRTLGHIRERGLRAGVALNPATPLVLIEHVLHLVDLVLIMSVNPGFGGQRFLPEVLPKAQRLHEMRASSGSALLIEMDGGLDEETVGDAVRAGVDVVVAGTAVFEWDDRGEAIRRLRSRGLESRSI